MYKKLKKHIAMLLTVCTMLTFVSACGSKDENIESTKSNSSAEPTAVTVTLNDGDTCIATGTSLKEVSLVNETTLSAGMKITVTLEGGKYVFLKIGTAFEEALLYLSDGIFEYTVPNAENQKVYPTGAWSGTVNITARIPTDDELKVERNLAYNPYDTQLQAQYYPHASADSECRNDRAFLARNSIDGFSVNTGHGDYPYQSWGPEQIEAPELYVDFGREVVVTQVIIYIRADFPHDTYWSSGKIAYSDGTATEITLEKTAEAQIFDLEGKKTTGISLTELTGQMGWAGITEIQIIGKEIL